MDELYEIKHRFNGSVLFSVKAGSLRWAVEAAVKAKAKLSLADLSGADLSGAKLLGAALSGAKLSGADLSGAKLFGADLSWTDLSWTNLSGAKLSLADLSGANLSGARLSGVDLYMAKLSGVEIKHPIEIQKRPIQLYGLHDSWNVTIWDEHMQIGCEFHTLNDWFSFDDQAINKMDRHALKWWRKNKDWVKALCVAHGRYDQEE